MRTASEYFAAARELRQKNEADAVRIVALRRQASELALEGELGKPSASEESRRVLREIENVEREVQTRASAAEEAERRALAAHRMTASAATSADFDRMEAVLAERVEAATRIDSAILELAKLVRAYNETSPDVMRTISRHLGREMAYSLEVADVSFPVVARLVALAGIYERRGLSDLSNGTNETIETIARADQARLSSRRPSLEEAA